MVTVPVPAMRLAVESITRSLAVISKLLPPVVILVEAFKVKSPVPSLLTSVSIVVVPAVVTLPLMVSPSSALMVSAPPSVEAARVRELVSVSDTAPVPEVRVTAPTKSLDALSRVIVLAMVTVKLEVPETVNALVSVMFPFIAVTDRLPAVPVLTVPAVPISIFPVIEVRVKFKLPEDKATCPSSRLVPLSVKVKVVKLVAEVRL